MLHQNALDLLQRFKATVLFPALSNRIYHAALNQHWLEWYCDRWSRRIRTLRYFPPDRVFSQRATLYLAWPIRRVGNGTLVKLFIEKALCKSWAAQSIEVTYGPDATRDLADTLRVRVYSEATLTLRDKESLAVGKSAANGEMPVEALFDWLKDRHVEA